VKDHPVKGKIYEGGALEEPEASLSALWLKSLQESSTPSQRGHANDPGTVERREKKGR